MTFINNFTIVLIISSIGLQCVNSQTWDLTDIENVDNLFSSWLTYGRMLYYQYQLEGDAIFCVINGIWKIVRDHIVEQSRMKSQTSTPEVVVEPNSDSTEKYNISSENPRLKRSTNTSTSNLKRSASASKSKSKQVKASLLASLLGITGEKFPQYYDRTLVRVKKSVDKTWHDDVKMGDLERAILKSLARSNPIINVLLNFIGNIIYLIHSIWAFMRSSVVLTCVSDYTVSRTSEFMYLDV